MTDTYGFLFETLGQCESLEDLTIKECDPLSPHTSSGIRTVQEKLFKVIQNMTNLRSLVWEENTTDVQYHTTYDGT
jgi:hypothetical protein